MRNEGFTLLETTIVIGIMIILSAIMIGYNRSSEKQIALYKDQAIIVGLINRAKSLALQRFNTSGVEVCAFGVYFDAQATPNRFILFQDKKRTGTTPCKNNNGVYLENGSYDISEELTTADIFTLHPKLKFKDISGSSDGNIIFIPPELEIKTDASPFVVNIQSVDGSLCSSIEIGVGGQITEKDSCI